MKKKDYLEFHAKVIYAISQKHKKNFYWIFNDLDNEKSYSYENRIDNAGNFYRQQTIELKTEKDVLNAVMNKAKIGYISNFKEDYLELVFKLGTHDAHKFFVSHNSSLVDEYPLYTINQLIPKLSADAIGTIFKEGTSTLPKMDTNALKNTFKLLKNHKEAPVLFETFLKKHYKSISYDHELSSIRDHLIQYFPEHLEKFSFLHHVANYLSSKNNHNDIDVYLDSGVEKTIYLRIDHRLLPKKYYIEHASIADLGVALKNLFVSLQGCAEESGVVKAHVRESYDENKLYQYTHIYVNLNEKSKLDSDTLKKLVDLYFSQYLPAYSAEHNGLHNSIIKTPKWISSALLENRLKAELGNDNAINKRNKI